MSEYENVGLTSCTGHNGDVFPNGRFRVQNSIFGRKCWLCTSLKSLEAIQRRACQTVVGDYSINHAALNLDSLSERRQQQCQTRLRWSRPLLIICFLLSMSHLSFVDFAMLTKKKLSRIHAKTNRFKNSFICFGLAISGNLYPAFCM